MESFDNGVKWEFGSMKEIRFQGSKFGRIALMNDAHNADDQTTSRDDESSDAMPLTNEVIVLQVLLITYLATKVI